MPNLLIKNATLPSGSKSDILIDGEQIVTVGTNLAGEAAAAGATEIDATGLVALPGFALALAWHLAVHLLRLPSA